MHPGLSDLSQTFPDDLPSNVHKANGFKRAGIFYPTPVAFDSSRLERGTRGAIRHSRCWRCGGFARNSLGYLHLYTPRPTNCSAGPI